MYLRLNPLKAESTTKRLSMNGFEFGGKLNEDYEHTYAGVRLLTSVFDAETGTLESVVPIGIRKHAVQVSLNPELGVILGRSPSTQAVLTIEHEGPLAVVVGRTNKEQAAEIAVLPWLAELFIVPVTTLND